MTLRPTNARSARLAAWLRVLVIALLVALAVPATGMAEEGAAAAGTGEWYEAPAEPAASGTTATAAEPAPVAQEPAPAETTTTAPAEESPAPAEEPVVEAPAAASEPEPTAAPAPSGDAPADTPLPVIVLPEITLPLEPAPPVRETVAPMPGVGELVPALLAPEVPRYPVIGFPPVEAPKAVAPSAPPVPAVPPPLVVAPGDLGGPPVLGGVDPVSRAARVAVSGVGASAVASAPLRPVLVFGPAGDGPGPAAGRAPVADASMMLDGGASATIAPAQLVSPAGPAPAQSILAVLASYILPGSGPVPAGLVFVLVMLGVILLAAVAPRPGGSERLWLAGLLGPRAGHALAVRRPG